MKPVRQYDYYDPFKTKEKSSVHDFRFSYKDSAERTKDKIKKAEIFDTVPSPPKFIFRKWLTKKSEAPSFRFQPKTNQERVLDYINKRGFSQLQVPSVLNEIEFIFYKHIVNWKD